jgi:PAS domain S-box-containing protein
MAFEWDPTTGLSQRDNAERVLGFEQCGIASPSRSEFIRRVHADDRECFKTRIRELRPGNPAHACAFRFVRPDGRQVRLEETAQGEFDATGRHLRIKGLTRDITERKLAELALAERNTQLVLVSETARVGSLAIEFHTGLVKLSPSCASILGLPANTVEMSSDNASKLMLSDDLGPLERRRDQAFLKQQREFVAQFRIRRADDGEIRWIEARNLIFYDQSGKPAQMIGVRIDFTDRKLAADMLAERNLQFALAGKAGLVGSYAYDVNTEMMQVSEGYAAIHGLPEGTTETTVSQWKTRVHPEDLARAENLRAQTFADQRGEYSLEYRILRSDGEVRWIERRSFISYDGDGFPQRVVGVTIDVTERKQAEEHRNILNAELDHRVKNVLATVGAIILQAQRANASTADFVACVDHRIKSLASTHELLSHSRWHGVSLSEIIRREFAPYTTGNTEISGPSVTLTVSRRLLRRRRWYCTSSQPTPQNMAHYPTTAAGCHSGGSGYRMEFNTIGWPSNGKRSAAPQLQRQVRLATRQASFANLSLMNSGERLIFRLLPAASNVDWRFLLSVSAATAALRGQRQLQALLSIRRACRLERGAGFFVSGARLPTVRSLSLTPVFRPPLLGSCVAHRNSVRTPCCMCSQQVAQSASPPVPYSCRESGEVQTKIGGIRSLAARSVGP